MVADQRRACSHLRFVVMGVSGAGKTTLGRALAERLGMAFVDGDDLHPAENIAKMQHGEALDDADRAPWLRAVADAIGRYRERGEGLVIACSALKRRYRDRLRAADERLKFVHLSATRDVLSARLRSRSGHFMAADMLDSQLATLEPPGTDEDVLTLDASLPVATLVDSALNTLRARTMP